MHTIKYTVTQTLRFCTNLKPYALYAVCQVHIIIQGSQFNEEHKITTTIKTTRKRIHLYLNIKNNE
jgi:hypothetical protein